MLQHALSATDPRCAATLLRWTAFATLFLAVLMPPDMTTASGQANELRESPVLEAVEPEVPSPTEAGKHKWFISVVTMRNCGPCARLKDDFAHAEALADYVNVNDRRESWSHYGVYLWDDPTQSWRWENIQLTTFPTIIIQPPRSGEYGDPRTVVWQKVGYDGNERQLAKDIRRAILSYVAKLPPGLASAPPFGPAGPRRSLDVPGRHVLRTAEQAREVGR